MANTVRFQLRGDTAANWESKNPVLLRNEPGFDTTNNRLKMGDGSTAWNDLPFLAPEVVDDLITGGSSNVLSAEQGKILKGLVDANTADNLEIKNTIDKKLDADNVTHETWEFTLEDESTVDKEVMLWNS